MKKYQFVLTIIFLIYFIPINIDASEFYNNQSIVSKNTLIQSNNQLEENLYDDCYVPFKFNYVSNKQSFKEDCITKKDKIFEDALIWDGKYEYEFKGFNIYIDDSICYQYVDDTQLQLNMIPNNMLELLKQQNWNITISKENLAQKYYSGIYSSVQGVTVYAEKRIELEDRYNAIQGACIHECAHAIDYELNRPSYSTSFQNVLLEDWNGLDIMCGSYKGWETDPFEAFAESFYYTYTQPKTFQKNCPNIYAYIRGLIET